MITQLPTEVQELIYNKLHVNDRVKLLMSIPRNHKIRIKLQSTERKLSILAKAINKRKLSKLSIPIVSFLAKCDPMDATLIEMSQFIPEVATISHYNSSHKSPAEKIKEGSITKEEIECLPVFSIISSEPADIYNAIYNCNVDTFKRLIETEHIYIWATTSFSFMFNLFNYANTELVTYLHNEGANTFEWDWRAVAEYIKSSPSILHCKDSLKLVLQFLPYSVDDLNEIWLNMMENMDIDAAVEIENKIQELQELQELQ
jgi:hypothetical protein